MIYYFLCEKLTGEIASYSDGNISYDKNKFNLIKINISKKEEIDIKTGKKKAIYKKNKLVLKDFNI